MNLLNVPAIVYTPSGESVTVRLTQTGPGLYEARVPAAESGAYVVAAMPKQGERSLAPALVGVSKSAGLELRSLESNAARLGQIAAASGGRMYPMDAPSRAAEVWDRAGLAPVEAAQPLWPVLLLWALGVYMLDIASRRVAWDRLLSREVAVARRLTGESQAVSVTGAWKTARERAKRERPQATRPAVRTSEGDRNVRVERAIEEATPVAEQKVREPLAENETSDTPRSGLLAAKKRAGQRFESDRDLSDP